MQNESLRAKYLEKKMASESLKESYVIKRVVSKKSTLKEQYDTKRSISKKSLLSEEMILAENTARLILEEIDKDELAKTSQVLSKLNAIAGAAGSVPAIGSAIKSASGEVNEFTGGGMKALAKRGASAIQKKFGAKAGANPILKSLSLLNSIEQGMAMVPTIVKNNLPNFDPAGESIEKQAAGDKKTLSNIEKSIVKAFKPGGLFASIKALFGKSGGMPYVTNAGAIAKGIMSMPAAEIQGLVSAAASGPSAADIGSTVKDMAKSSKSGGSEKTVPIKNAEDLAMVVAGTEAGNDQEKAQKAAEEAKKNPKKFTAKFVNDIASKSGQKPTDVLKVVDVLLKSGKLKASIQESASPRVGPRTAILEFSDATRALKLYTESGGSSRRWVELMLEASSEFLKDQALNNLDRKFGKESLARIESEQDFKSLLSDAELDAKKLDSDMLKTLMRKYTNNLRDALKSSKADEKTQNKLFGTFMDGFENYIAQAKKTEEKGGKDDKKSDKKKDKEDEDARIETLSPIEHLFIMNITQDSLNRELYDKYKNTPLDKLPTVEELYDEGLKFTKTKNYENVVKSNVKEYEIDDPEAYKKEQLSVYESEGKEKLKTALEYIEKEIKKKSDKGKDSEDSGFDFLPGNYKAFVRDKYKDTPVDELPTEEEEFENFKKALLADADANKEAKKRSTTVEKLVDKFLDKFKGEIEKAVSEVLEELKEKSEEGGDKDSSEEIALDDLDPQEILDFLIKEFNIDPKEKEAEQALVDLGPNALLDKVKNDNPGKKFEPSIADLGGYIKNTIVPLLKKKAEESGDKGSKFNFDKDMFNPETVRKYLENSLKNKEDKPQNEQEVLEEIKTFLMEKGDIFKQIAKEQKAEVEEVVDEFLKIHKKEFVDIIKSVLATIDDYKSVPIEGVIELLKQRLGKDKKIDLKDENAVIGAVSDLLAKTKQLNDIANKAKKDIKDVVKDYVAKNKDALLKAVKENVKPESPLKEIEGDILAAESIDEIVALLSKIDGKTPIDPENEKVTAGSQLAILQKIAKDPGKGKQLVNGLTDVVGLKKKVGEILTKKPKGKHGELASQLAKQLQDITPDAIAAILDAIPAYLMAEAAVRKRNALLLASRSSRI